jgi:hypothetical protein
MSDPCPPLTVQWGRIAKYTEEFVPCSSEEEARALAPIFQAHLAWRYVSAPYFVEDEDGKGGAQ